jgi:hypothetical protein
MGRERSVAAACWPAKHLAAGQAGERASNSRRVKGVGFSDPSGPAVKRCSGRFHAR